VLFEGEVSNIADPGVGHSFASAETETEMETVSGIFRIYSVGFRLQRREFQRGLTGVRLGGNMRRVCQNGRVIC
jgi:hypothetical protein